MTTATLFTPKITSEFDDAGHNHALKTDIDSLKYNDAE